MAKGDRPRRVEFNVTALLRRTNVIRKRALTQLGVEMTADVQAKLDTPHPPASAPGTYAHRRRGVLRKKTTVKHVSGQGMVVKTTQIGIWLQGGTRRIRPRKVYREAIFKPGKGNKLKDRWVKRANALIRKFKRSK